MPERNCADTDIIQPLCSGYHTTRNIILGISYYSKYHAGDIILQGYLLMWIRMPYYTESYGWWISCKQDYHTTLDIMKKCTDMRQSQCWGYHTTWDINISYILPYGPTLSWIHHTLIYCIIGISQKLWECYERAPTPAGISRTPLRHQAQEPEVNKKPW